MGFVTKFEVSPVKEKYDSRNIAKGKIPLIHFQL